MNAMITEDAFKPHPPAELSFSPAQGQNSIIRSNTLYAQLYATRCSMYTRFLHLEYRETKRKSTPNRFSSISPKSRLASNRAAVLLYTRLPFRCPMQQTLRRTPQFQSYCSMNLSERRRVSRNSNILAEYKARLENCAGDYEQQLYVTHAVSFPL